jgi:hypothetical protein
METYFRHIGYYPENADQSDAKIRSDVAKTQNTFVGYKSSMEAAKARMQTAQMYREQVKRETPRPVYYRCEHCGV